MQMIFHSIFIFGERLQSPILCSDSSVDCWSINTFTLSILICWLDIMLGQKCSEWNLSNCFWYTCSFYGIFTCIAYLLTGLQHVFVFFEIKKYNMSKIRFDYLSFKWRHTQNTTNLYFLFNCTLKCHLSNNFQDLNWK